MSPKPDRVWEAPTEHPVPLLIHTEWAESFPWLLAGITSRGAESEPWDLRLAAEGPERAETLERWRRLSSAGGFESAVVSRQVHGCEVLIHRSLDPGRTLATAADGHITDSRGVLLAVTVADCVPVYLLGAQARVVALLHAGWRSAAGGILERAMTLLLERFGVAAGDVHMHLGPAICGRCYEVGPEVHAALDQPIPADPEPIDLREVLRTRAERAGVGPSRVTTSGFCTMCGGSPFFSHRSGDAERQVAVLGIRSVGTGE